MPPNKTNPPIAEELYYHLNRPRERERIKSVFRITGSGSERVGETYGKMPEGFTGSLKEHEPLFTTDGRQVPPLQAEVWRRMMTLKVEEHFEKFDSPHDALAAKLMYSTCRINVRPDSNSAGMDLEINADFDHHMQPILKIMADAVGGNIFTKVDYSSPKGYGDGTRHYMLKNIPNGPEVVRRLAEAIKNIPPRMNPLRETYSEEALRSFIESIIISDPERHAAIQYVDENIPGSITVRFGLQEDMEGIDTSDYQEGTQAVKVSWMEE